MLRIIEFSLLAVSLLVIAGLILSGSRSTPRSSEAQPPALANDDSETGKPGKTL